MTWLASGLLLRGFLEEAVSFLSEWQVEWKALHGPLGSAAGTLITIIQHWPLSLPSPGSKEELRHVWQQWQEQVGLARDHLLERRQRIGTGSRPGEREKAEGLTGCILVLDVLAGDAPTLDSLSKSWIELLLGELAFRWPFCTRPELPVLLKGALQTKDISHQDNKDSGSGGSSNPNPNPALPDVWAALLLAIMSRQVAVTLSKIENIFPFSWFTAHLGDLLTLVQFSRRIIQNQTTSSTSSKFRSHQPENNLSSGGVGGKDSSGVTSLISFGSLPEDSEDSDPSVWQEAQEV